MTTSSAKNSQHLADAQLVELTGRRAYGARIVGNDRRYGMAREFCQRRYSWQGRRGLWAIVVEPGWYEFVTYEWGVGRRIRYEAWNGRHWEPIPARLRKYLPTAAEGPAPGTPGAWNGELCRCGRNVDHYTPEGFPQCEECHQHERSTAA